MLSGAHPGAPGGIGAADYLAHVDAALARIVADLREDARAGRPDAFAGVVPVPIDWSHPQEPV